MAATDPQNFEKLADFFRVQIGVFSLRKLSERLHFFHILAYTGRNSPPTASCLGSSQFGCPGASVDTFGYPLRLRICSLRLSKV